MRNKIKKLMATTLSLAMIFTTTLFNNNYVFAEDVPELTVEVNGVEIDFSKYGAEPFIENGSTYVPLRSVFESFGGVERLDKTLNPLGTNFKDDPNLYMFDIENVGDFDIEITLNIKERMMPFNSYILVQYWKENQPFMFDLSKYDIILQDGRTYLPLRGISEAFGYEVGWVNDTRTVEIDTSNPTNRNMDMINAELETINNQVVIEPTTPVVEEIDIDNFELDYANELRAKYGLAEQDYIDLTREENNEIMLIKVNELRAENGLNPLELDEQLIELAFAKAEDWNLGGYSKDAVSSDGYSGNHVSPRYGNPIEMYKVMFGEEKDIWENFAKSSNVNNSVITSFKQWENSEGHLRAMLQPHLTKMGFGYVLVNGTEDRTLPTYVMLLEMY